MGQKDLLGVIVGYSLAAASFTMSAWAELHYQWILKYGCYVGIFTMFIFSLSLRIRAEGIDPRSKQAFKEYLKLGSFLCFIFIVMEIPIWITVQ
jgi:hypothetical protein